MNDSTKISEIKAEILALRKKADNMEKALHLLFSNAEPLKSEPISSNLVVDSSPARLTEPRVLSGTFADKVSQLLNSGDKLRASDLRLHFDNMAYNSFSAQLSNLVKKGRIKKIVVENANNKDKYFYQL